MTSTDDSFLHGAAVMIFNFIQPVEEVYNWQH